MANPDCCMLPPAAEPEMTMIHQEVNAVIFGRNRVWMLLGNVLQDAGAFHIQLVSTRSALLRPHFAANDDRTLLRESLQCFEDLFGELALHGNTLDHAAAIANNREDNLSGFAQIVEPARNLHSLSNVPAGIGDADSTHRLPASAYSVRINS